MTPRMSATWRTDEDGTIHLTLRRPEAEIPLSEIMVHCAECGDRAGRAFCSACSVDMAERDRAARSDPAAWADWARRLTARRHLVHDGCVERGEPCGSPICLAREAVSRGL